MHPDFDRFKLTAEDHEFYFNELLRTSFWLKNPSNNPCAIFLGGQPGSGKSGLITLSGKDLQNNAVVINGDEYRGIHPDSDQILIEDEQNYARLTDPDVRVWTQRVLQHALENRFNVVFESTMRSPYPITSTLLQFKDAGIAVIARPMAVSAMESITGVFNRYETQKMGRGHGRMAPISVHDEAYRGALNTVDEIFTKQAAHAIQIYDRSLQKIHEIAPLTEDTAPSCYIEHQRNKPVLMNSAMSIVENWSDIFESMTNRKASEVEWQNACESWAVVKSELYARLEVNLAQKAMLNNEISGLDSKIIFFEKAANEKPVIKKKERNEDLEP